MTSVRVTTGADAWAAALNRELRSATTALATAALPRNARRVMLLALDTGIPPLGGFYSHSKALGSGL
jgi:hypothetical protein